MNTTRKRRPGEQRILGAMQHFDRKARALTAYFGISLGAASAIASSWPDKPGTEPKPLDQRFPSIWKPKRYEGRMLPF